MNSAQQPPVDPKERQILFTAPMVRAILSGQKTVTRRVIKPQPTLETDDWVLDAGGTGKWMASGPSPATGGTRQTRGWSACPYGKPGDRLWVRETLEVVAAWGVYYAASGPNSPEGYLDEKDMRGIKLLERYSDHHDVNLARRIPSIHMPRWASRLLLEITMVRVERLQDISPDQAFAEGVDGSMCQQFLESSPTRFTCREAEIHGFSGLWESINGAGAWDTNPWVWVVEFKRVTP
ncbi:hypothetical protein ACYZTX_08130 [Pseudomonas sp. MDT1-17]